MPDRSVRRQCEEANACRCVAARLVGVGNQYREVLVHLAAGRHDLCNGISVNLN